MWPGLADNDEASSPTRVRDNQGLWEREMGRESGGEQRERWNEASGGGQKVERAGRKREKT